MTTREGRVGDLPANLTIGEAHVAHALTLVAERRALVVSEVLPAAALAVLDWCRLGSGHRGDRRKDRARRSPRSRSRRPPRCRCSRGWRASRDRRFPPPPSRRSVKHPFRQSSPVLGTPTRTAPDQRDTNNRGNQCQNRELRQARPIHTHHNHLRRPVAVNSSPEHPGGLETKVTSAYGAEETRIPSRMTCSAIRHMSRCRDRPCLARM